MVIIVLPDWWSEGKKKIEKVVREIALKNKINYSLVKDSKTIDGAIDMIMNTLWYISRVSQAEFWIPEEKPKKGSKEVKRKNE